MRTGTLVYCDKSVGLRWRGSQCAALVDGAGGEHVGAGAPCARAAGRAHGRGLHPSTFQLSLSALYGIGGARRGA